LNIPKFYIGETVSIEIEVYDLTDLSGYEFLLFLYTNNWEIIKMSTQDSKGTIKIERIGDNILEVTISNEITREIRPGLARLEIAVKERENEWISIGMIGSIIFLPNEIGQYNETFVETNMNFLNECDCES